MTNLSKKFLKNSQNQANKNQTSHLILYLPKDSNRTVHTRRHDVASIGAESDACDSRGVVPEGGLLCDGLAGVVDVDVRARADAEVRPKIVESDGADRVLVDNAQGGLVQVADVPDLHLSVVGR